MNKPKYLYHGSTQKLSIIQPHQAAGLPEENGNLNGVYAYESFDMARRFAMPIEKVDGRLSVIFEEETGRIILNKGIVHKTDVGYVHKVLSDTFEKIDQWQWFSRASVAVEEVIEVRTADIWNYIDFKGNHNE